MFPLIRSEGHALDPSFAAGRGEQIGLTTEQVGSSSHLVRMSLICSLISPFHLLLLLILQVGLFDKFAGEAFDTFTQLADELREDFAFRHTSSAEALGSPILSPPAVRLFREFESTPADAGSDVSSSWLLLLASSGL